MTAAHADAAGDDGHGTAGRGTAAPAVKGLAVFSAGWTLELDTRERPAGRPTALRFRIVDERGAAVKRFAVEHERRMHLIVVRRDQTGFQHLHPPRMRREGTCKWAITGDATAGA